LAKTDSKGSSASSGTNVLRIEKRVVDLELELNELKEQIQGMDVSGIPELKQKIDDIEDLIMVEQAAILELKKMLESEKPAVPEDLEKRIGDIEANVQNAVNKTDLDARIEDIEKELASQTKQTTPVEIEELYNKISQIETGMSDLKTRSENFSKEFDERIGEVIERPTRSKQSAIDIDLLSSKIEAVKENLDKISRSRLDLELKISEITKKMEIMEKNIGRSPEQVIIGGLKMNRKEIVAAHARIDSIERVARELMADVQNFEKSISGFESLKRISLLGKNIDDNLEKTKFIEDEVKRLQSRIQNIYDDIDKRIDKMHDLEKKYSDDIPNLMETVETNKSQIEDMEKRIHNLGRQNTGDARHQIESMHFALNRLNGKIASLEKIKPVFENRLIEIRKGLYPMINEGLRPIHKRIEFFEKKMKETKTSEIGKILTDMTMKMAVIENKVDSLEKGNENNMEKFRTIIREKIGGMKDSSIMDEQFKEMVNRIIYLESRIRGIESSIENMAKNFMEDRSRIQPIIIE
jgi:chromosome segregation ATPase